VGSFRFFDGEDLDDVGVIECGDSFGFAFETGAAFFTFGQIGREDFERDLTVLTWCPRPNTHPPSHLVQSSLGIL